MEEGKKRHYREKIIRGIEKCKKKNRRNIFKVLGKKQNKTINLEISKDSKN